MDDPDPVNIEWLEREYAARLHALERISPASEHQRLRLWADVLRVAGIDEEPEE